MGMVMVWFGVKREEEGCGFCFTDCKNGKASGKIGLSLDINTNIATCLMFNSPLALPLDTNLLV
jgi:hypothetical protein